MGKDARSPINGKAPPESGRFQAGENASRNGRKGAAVTNAKIAARKTLKEELVALLDVVSEGKDGREHTTQEAISVALVRQALNGNVKAYAMIRDTIGEMPAQTVNVTQVDYSALDAISYDAKTDK